jgi:hypothetical protein
LQHALLMTEACTEAVAFRDIMCENEKGRPAACSPGCQISRELV